MSTRSLRKTILSCSKGLVHPTVWARKFLDEILLNVQNCNVIHSKDIKYKHLIEKHQPDLIILYMHEKKIHRDDLAALDKYVSNGGAILAIHSASASFKQEPTYHKLLGGRFVNHGPICTYRIYPIESTHNSLPVLDRTFTIKDELYIHEFSDDVEVLLETKIDKSSEPVAWIKKHRKGKVAYFALGHRGNIFQQESVQKVILELIEWGFLHE